jgi:hypothetical protein
MYIQLLEESIPKLWTELRVGKAREKKKEGRDRRNEGRDKRRDDRRDGRKTKGEG